MITDLPNAELSAALSQLQAEGALQPGWVARDSEILSLAAGDTMPTADELSAALERARLHGDTLTAREQGRAALRTAYRTNVPAFIRGLYREEFNIAIELLAEGDDEAAIERLRFLQPHSNFTAAHLLAFDAARSDMIAAIQSLPPAA